MELSIKDIAQRVGGTVHGDAETLIAGAESISKAGPCEITFAVDDRNLRLLASVQPGAILIERNRLEQVLRDYPERNWVAVDDPMGAFIEIIQILRPQRERSKVGISPQAMVAKSAQIGAGCNIHPGAVIGEDVVIGAGCEIHPGVVISDDCRVGADCTIYPNAVLYPRVIVGNRVIIHASAVIGADGFGYRMQQGRFVKIPQLGTVHLEDNVEIGACTTVDRAMIGVTVIGEGTKLDNLVMIGHNCELGKHNAFASQVGLAGSVTTGNYVRCAGQVGIADHVHIGDQTLLGAKAGIHRDMEGGKSYLGSPATEEQEQFRVLMAMRKLPDMRRQLRELESQVAELSKQFKEQQVDVKVA